MHSCICGKLYVQVQVSGGGFDGGGGAGTKSIRLQSAAHARAAVLPCLMIQNNAHFLDFHVTTRSNLVRPHLVVHSEGLPCVCGNRSQTQFCESTSMLINTNLITLHDVILYHTCMTTATPLTPVPEQKFYSLTMLSTGAGAAGRMAFDAPLT